MKAFIPQPQSPPPPSVDYYYYVPKWGQHGRGFIFDATPSGFIRIREYSLGSDIFGGPMMLPLDPITAISLGLVTPEEINMPEGLRAAFNLLK